MARGRSTVPAELHELGAIDRLLHEPARLMIAAVLYPLERADFVALLRETRLTRGNLSSHLSRLEEAGYLAIEKSFRGRVPHTACRLTASGREALRSYREALKSISEKLGG